MKFNLLSAFFSLAIIISAALFSSCEREVISPVDETSTENIYSQDDLKKGNGKGKKNKNDPPDDPSDDPPSDPVVTTYQLSQADDFDPLFRFSLTQAGDLMYLETDPTVTSWGTDYWGYWSDPFAYSNNELNYIVGLTNVTYKFETLSNNRIDVTKVLIVQPYPSGSPTTTISHPGIYRLVN